ncbi:MAG TPA: L-threonylcarbamoyladenylate synthase [Planctomycetota bacterium]|nr:L-threonylcarbamoyladenylate synthase [Planctomycetota bacterium]
MLDLSPRWFALWKRLHAQGDAQAVLEDLLRRYREPLRAYHNIEHLTHCFEELDTAAASDERDLVELALWFHDAVYDAQAKDNEERSGDLLRSALSSAGLNDHKLTRASQLILATKTHEASDSASMLMLDCDLAILAQPREVFQNYERAIRTEYGWVPADKYRAGRADVLQRFLNRAHIFHTESFRKRYEQIARGNLRWSIERLRNEPLFTRLRRIDQAQPEQEILDEAADVLRSGGLVAFPTETVYGLGANALNSDAVLKIFNAKGRPTNNPIIVHVESADTARGLVKEWPETAARLAATFWPGPLTLVLPKSPNVPDAVTAGGPTVAIRSPRHPVALALLKAAGVPIAAPSANRSTEVSPTRAEHVLKSLDGRIELILDGGPCSGGIESTVLDLSVTPPRLLRPGLITVEQIERITGSVTTVPTATSDAVPLPSPGMLERHYAPKASVEIAPDSGEARVRELLAKGHRVGWLSSATEFSGPKVRQIRMPDDAPGYAAQLYAALHELDAAGVEFIIVSRVPDTPDWLAIRDRLKRASHPG